MKIFEGIYTLESSIEINNFFGQYAACPFSEEAINYMNGIDTNVDEKEIEKLIKNAEREIINTISSVFDEYNIGYVYDNSVNRQFFTFDVDKSDMEKLSGLVKISEPINGIKTFSLNEDLAKLVADEIYSRLDANLVDLLEYIIYDQSSYFSEYYKNKKDAITSWISYLPELRTHSLKHNLYSAYSILIGKRDESDNNRKEVLKTVIDVYNNIIDNDAELSKYIRKFDKSTTDRILSEVRTSNFNLMYIHSTSNEYFLGINVQPNEETISLIKDGAFTKAKLKTRINRLIKQLVTN